jgi:hypothetical protein
MFVSAVPPAINCPPQHPRQKGRQHNNAAATDGKQQSTNAQRQMSDNSRMRWRMTAADKMRRMEKKRWCGNGQATMVGGRGATMALTTMATKQQSTNVRQQRRRTTTPGKRQQMNNNGAQNKQQRSMTEDDGGYLDRTTADDQLRHSR